MSDTNIDENKTICVGGRPQLLNARSFFRDRAWARFSLRGKKKFTTTSGSVTEKGTNPL